LEAAVIWKRVTSNRQRRSAEKLSVNVICRNFAMEKMSSALKMSLNMNLSNVAMEKLIATMVNASHKTINAEKFGEDPRRLMSVMTC
jgi:hypothetical protein